MYNNNVMSNNNVPWSYITSNDTSTSINISKAEDLYNFLIYKGYIDEDEFERFRELKNKIENI